MNRNKRMTQCKLPSSLPLCWVRVRRLVVVHQSHSPVDIDYPAGVACAFPLGIEGSGGHIKALSFIDKNGNVVRIQATGTGSALTVYQSQHRFDAVDKVER